MNLMFQPLYILLTVQIISFCSALEQTVSLSKVKVGTYHNRRGRYGGVQSASSIDNAKVGIYGKDHHLTSHIYYPYPIYPIRYPVYHPLRLPVYLPKFPIYPLYKPQKRIRRRILSKKPIHVIVPRSVRVPRSAPGLSGLLGPGLLGGGGLLGPGLLGGGGLLGPGLLGPDPGEQPPGGGLLGGILQGG